MFLREKDGFYAGKIREFPSHIGLQLLASGRAENPYAESSAPAPAQEAPQEVVKSRRKARS